MTEKKQLKKAYKKAKRKNVTLWKTLSIFCLVVALICGILTPVLGMFDNTLANFVGGQFYELVNEDENAIYYEMDFDSEEEMIAYGSEVVREVEAEGAVLLLNENNALPLAEGSKVSCFSNSSVSLVYGGAGSASTDTSRADDLKTALEKSGFSVNEALWNFYTEGAGSEYHRVEGGLVPVVPETCEVPWEVYSQEVLDSVSAYGDAAIVVLSRTGAEQYDLTFDSYNYLALDENERAMFDGLQAMKDAGTISKIVVLLNSSNTIQLDFLQDYDIDACLWVGVLGESGVNAVADILCGKVNPSGNLVDTYCYNNYSAPAMWNFAPASYDAEDGQIPSSATKYLVYQEGIYVGYKYYETRYEDFIMGTGNAGSYDYAGTVAYPFGYGLTYTTFVYSDMAVEYNADMDQYIVSVTVTNTGDVAGKEAVQIYAQTPYTQYDIDNGIEKASIALVGFGKTGLLEPGASETVTAVVNRRDLASFDTYGTGTYILDAGDYYLTVADNAHEAVNNILAAKGYTTADGMTAEGDKSFVYAWTEDTLDTTTYAVSTNGTPITNQLSVADPNLYEGSDTDVTWLSRSDWSGTFPMESVKIALTEMMTADFRINKYDPTDYPAVEMPTLAADNGLSVYDMMGKDYDDPDWEKLLDQLTFDEMVSLIGDAFHFRMSAESVNAPGARDENGPQGLTMGTATAFTSGDVMAASFDPELIYKVGTVLGNNCLSAGVDALYGPGSNIHRTPYGGRNFEYYSEDGYLSGIMTAASVEGIQSKGVDVLIKHFALNDSETDRLGIGVWVNEQAAREIYLKAFQAAFEEAEANGVMVAYTRWGTTWSGAVKGLMTGILRQEWGNNGWSITDNIIVDYITGADGVLAGTTAYDSMLPTVTNELKTYENDPVMVSAMREACHHNLYALANSAAMNGVAADTQVVATEHFLIGIVRNVAIVLGLLGAFFLIFWVKGSKKLKATQAYQDYRNFRKNK